MKPICPSCEKEFKVKALVQINKVKQERCAVCGLMTYGCHYTRAENVKKYQFKWLSRLGSNKQENTKGEILQKFLDHSDKLDW